MNDIGPDDETQDMSGETVSEGTTPSPPPSHTSSSSTNDHTVVDGGGGDTHASSSKIKPRKRKLGKREATNELMEKMMDMQEKSDKLMMTLEEKRIKMEERQMELDAQMRKGLPTSDDANISTCVSPWTTTTTNTPSNI